MMRCRQVWLAALPMVLFPAVAHANAGTPLMWAAAIHLVVGNAMLGVFEGLLLGFLFRTSIWKAVLLMIAANYASAWLGFWLLGFVDPGNVDATIENIQLWQWGFIFTAFLLTLVVEFPFIWLSLRKKTKPLFKAAVACLLIQSISYALLVGWYVSASNSSLITSLQVVSPSEMGAPDGYSLYYIAADGERVVRSDLTGENIETVGEVQAKDPDDRLFVRGRDENGYDLLLLQEHGHVLVLEDFADAATMDWQTERNPSSSPEPTSFNCGFVPKVDVESDWEYDMGYWAVEGISGRQTNGDSSFLFALETPFAALTIRNGTHIAGDFAVFQLGRDQICILQPEEKRIALIARGKGPVVAKERVDNSHSKRRMPSEVP